MNHGRLIAKTLAGAWRRYPPPLEITARELADVTPLLLQTGAGALGWRQVQHSGLRISTAALQLQQAYYLHAVQAELHERRVREAIELFRSNGIEAVLVKGWAIARLYVDPGLRPCGDIDLCVDPDQYPAAKAVLDEVVSLKYRIDLHKGFEKFGFGRQIWRELHTRCSFLAMGDLPVRTLSSEDHLRLLCFHFLREGAWRPLWLCDVALSLEERPPDFDWELCLGTTARSKDSVIYTIALAQYLLQANLEGVPPIARAKRMPSWLLPSVLKEWDMRSMYERHRSPFALVHHRPIHTLRRIGCHWPSPVEATINLNAPFNEAPRLPIQIGDSFMRAMSFVLRFPGTSE